MSGKRGRRLRLPRVGMAIVSATVFFRLGMCTPFCAVLYKPV